MATISSLFHLDNLALVTAGLIIFVGLSVAVFSWRYMKGDRACGNFYLRLSLIIISTLIMVSADNIILFLASWSLSNILLVLLMIHKSSWEAARKSGFLAFKNFTYGFMALAAAFAVIYLETGETSIEAVATYPLQLTPTIIAAILILAAAMTQSALWPFHRWLISSLNSPTPVSAMMHAGLINGGGFLLVRFKELYLHFPESLNIIFITGLITAFLGTLWKLLQSDVKRMLACSTMSQMGFMIMQCGLGLFSAAIAHLVWHGMFKSYFFLASGAAAQEKRLSFKGRP
ncbi:MAG TPA: proton-conducting transporter membrane subunit [Alphaproteobacteria bacterium]|nr:proton-conducting transporter membrane subunit [Alphaproteobacteria bacterium]